MGNDRDQGRDKRRWGKTVEMLSLGPYFGACVLIGFGGGWLLDKRLGLKVPWFTIAGVLLGSAAGFRQLFRYAQHMNESERKD